MGCTEFLFLEQCPQPIKVWIWENRLCFRTKYDKISLFDYKKMKRCRRMSVIQVILSIIYVILGVAISVVILMQEGAVQRTGGAIGGISQTVTGVRTEAVPWKVRWSTLPGMEPLYLWSLPLPERMIHGVIREQR